MTHSLSTAAAACGVNKSTILRAIKNGKISATKDENGQWQIQPVELHRTYPPYTEARTDAPHDATAVLEAQIAGLKEVADLLRVQLEDVREDRDRWREQAATVTRQLPDQRERKPWWRRFRR
jgi:predicted site-specific integrase-resolvase